MINNNNNTLIVLDSREVLGMDFKIYGTAENPLFLAKDVAEWIGHSNVTHMVKNVDEDERCLIIVNTFGGNQEALALTEDGLYEVLMQSRKQIAKQFKKEIKAVLKQIRLTGGAVVENREEEFIANYFPSFSEDVKKAMILDLKKQNEALKLQIQEQQLKVEYHDAVLNPEKLVTIGGISKDLGLTATKLNKLLYDKKIQFKKGNSWVLYSDYDCLVTEGFADYKITQYGQQLRWTEKGRKWIIDLFQK